MKSTIEEIRDRFDHDVERFSNENTGQTSTVDSALVLDMLLQSIRRLTPRPERVLDIGCGAGNFTVRLLRELGPLRCGLIDLSLPMLERARERVEKAGGVVDTLVQEDVRKVALGVGTYDLVSAAAVLHHLRTREEWAQVFRNIFQSLRPLGTFWFWDLIKHENEEVEAVQRDRYAAYLTGLKDEAYQRGVFEYVEKEDTPESVSFILSALREAGFGSVDVIHKNSCFAALMARKV